MAQIKLQTNDQKCFIIDVKIAMFSKTIKTMLEDLGTEGLEDDIIPLPNVNGVIFEKIIEWADHHKDDPPFGEEEDGIDTKIVTDLSEWDKKFLDVDAGTFFAIILASNYLDVSPLLDTCCKHMANLIKGKNVDEIRQILNTKPRVQSCQDLDAMDTEVSNKEEEEKKSRSNSKESEHENLASSISDRPICSGESS